jgi:prepilin-type N-terminal cleavage/methylation domain-containing protein
LSESGQIHRFKQPACELQPLGDSMARTNKKLGFTLVEVMIVVAILGILAAVAVGTYSIYIKRSRSAEATAVLSDIRVKQEAYRATFHQYATLPGNTFNPDAQNGAPHKWLPGIAAWQQLGIVGQGNFYFYGYHFQAGPPNDASADGRYTNVGLDVVNDFWYGATAREDLDMDGNYAGFVIVSNRNNVLEIKEEDW